MCHWKRLSIAYEVILRQAPTDQRGSLLHNWASKRTVLPIQIRDMGNPASAASRYPQTDNRAGDRADGLVLLLGMMNLTIRPATNP